MSNKIRTKLILEELSEKLESIKTDNTFLYFITRVLKPDTKKTSKILDKYLFKVYQIDVNDEIREHLFSLTKEQLEFLTKRKTELHEYDVITEDTEQLFTYSMTNKAMSFTDVVNNQLKSNPPKIKSLEEIISEEIEVQGEIDIDDSSIQLDDDGQITLSLD